MATGTGHQLHSPQGEPAGTGCAGAPPDGGGKAGRPRAASRLRTALRRWAGLRCAGVPGVCGKALGALHLALREVPTGGGTPADQHPPHFLLESAEAHARSAQSGQRRMRARTPPCAVLRGRRSFPRRAVTSPVADARGAGPPNATASHSHPRRR